MKVPEPRKLPSGSWFVRVMIDGKSISITKPTKKECQAEAVALKTGIKKKSVAPDEITLNRIDNDRVRAALTEEAAAAAGGPVGLALRVGEPPKRDPKENLQNLLAFASKHENITIK